MIRLKIPFWLANIENLAMELEGEVLGETSKAILVEGTMVLGPSINCRRCGRDLTHPASRVVGVGPECCEHWGISRPDYDHAVELNELLKEKMKFKRWFPKSRIEIEGTYDPPKPVTVPRRRLWVENEKIFLQVAFDDKEAAKSIPGRAWDPEKKAWSFPVESRVVTQAKTVFPDVIVESEIPVESAIPEPTSPAPLIVVDSRFPLYDYQKVGVDFLIGVERALLADDMGLGKTLQIIAVLERSGSKKVLIVAPNSMKYVWKREIAKWSPESTVQVVDGDKTTRITQIMGEQKYTIMNYEALRLHASISSGRKPVATLEPALDRQWDALVFDEAHRIKNRAATMTLVSRALAVRSKRVYHVTGTPIMNRSSELWSLLNILHPKTYGSFWAFAEKFCKVYHDGYGWIVEDFTDPTHPRVQLLRDTLKPLMIRRTKKEVLKDLPEKQVQQIWVDLDGSQKKIYDQMENAMLTELDTGQKISAAVVIAQITRLKQITIDPHLMIAESEVEISGAKIEALMDLVEGLNGQKFAVFSQFAKAISRLSTKFDKLGIQHVVISGEVTGEDRDTAVERFQTDPDCRAILLTTQAGGQGLTLTAASTAIFLDKCWTPALNIQAQDRLHRIGQKNPVTIYELLTNQSVEEYIEDLLAKKQQIFDQTIEGEDLFRALKERRAQR
jgi:SNF2 family DNA or RNA helicase